MTTPDLDLLIRQAVTGAQIETGRRPTGDLPVALFAGAHVQERSTRGPAWTQDEEEYIIKHYTTMSDEEIGTALGRTHYAVHVHREREMYLPAPSKAPGITTVNRAAKMLGMSTCHALEYWFRVGLVPGYKLPGGNMCQLIRMDEFTRWVCSPANWIYINIDKIKDKRLYRMTHKRRELWGNDWWTTTQVAEYHGLKDSKVIFMHIKHGYLKAVQPEYSIGGRELNRTWKPWRVLRSDAIALKIHTLHNSSQFTPAGEAWILRARNELKFSWVRIARSMNPRHPRPGRRIVTDGAVWQRHKKGITK